MIRNRDHYLYLTFPNFVIDGSIWPLRSVKNLRGEDIVFAKEAAIERAVFTDSSNYHPKMSKIRNYSYLDHAEPNKIDEIIRTSFNGGGDFPWRGVFVEDKTLSPVCIDTTAHWPATPSDVMPTFLAGKLQEPSGTPLALEAGSPLVGSDIEALYDNLRKMGNIYVGCSPGGPGSCFYVDWEGAPISGSPKCQYTDAGRKRGDLAWDVSSFTKVSLEYTPYLTPEDVVFWGVFCLQWDENIDGDGFNDRGIALQFDQRRFYYEYDNTGGFLTMEFGPDDFKGLLNRALDLAGCSNAYRKSLFLHYVAADITMSDHTKWW